jgi:hypothetical protein
MNCCQGRMPSDPSNECETRVLGRLQHAAIVCVRSCPWAGSHCIHNGFEVRRAGAQGASPRRHAAALWRCAVGSRSRRQSVVD